MMFSWAMLWALVPLAIGYLFRRGKLLFLIAGNNTATKPYDKRSQLAGRVVGLMMYVSALLVILVFIPNIPDLYYYILTVIYIIIWIVVIVYLNKSGPASG
ncbi:DUF3784 domain-containing protein [Lentilactobacillus diolivorans]|nr:DUF3784 domain-containing protein [Lentilactobacillus diolivorans]